MRTVRIADTNLPALLYYEQATVATVLNSKWKRIAAREQRKFYSARLRLRNCECKEEKEKKVNVWLHNFGLIC